jgi:hypothetical protein
MHSAWIVSLSSVLLRKCKLSAQTCTGERWKNEIEENGQALKEGRGKKRVVMFTIKSSSFG